MAHRTSGTCALCNATSVLSLSEKDCEQEMGIAKVWHPATNPSRCTISRKYAKKRACPLLFAHCSASPTDFLLALIDLAYLFCRPGQVERFVRRRLFLWDAQLRAPFLQHRLNSLDNLSGTESVSLSHCREQLQAQTSTRKPVARMKFVLVPV